MFPSEHKIHSVHIELLTVRFWMEEWSRWSLYVITPILGLGISHNSPAFDREVNRKSFWVGFLMCVWHCNPGRKTYWRSFEKEWDVQEIDYYASS